MNEREVKAAYVYAQLPGQGKLTMRDVLTNEGLIRWLVAFCTHNEADPAIEKALAGVGCDANGNDVRQNARFFCDG